MSTPNPAPTLAAFSQDLADIVERMGVSVVALQARRSYPSSAFIVQPGVVVTAAHTLRREDGITAIQSDGSATPATLVGVDPGTDIAVLRLESPLEPARATPVTFGDARAARPGNFVVAVSRGVDGSLAASAGVVARTGGEWRTWRGGYIDRQIQLDGGLWAGFSGGPVVDASGGVLGIGTSALSRGRAVVIPGSVLKRVSEQLLTGGRVSHAYIGAAVQSVELPSALRAQLGISSTHGLIVISTVPQGPADSAGILLGDTLLTLDEKPLSEVEDLKAALSADRVGQPVAVSLIRGGKLLALEATVGERPRDRC
ncbi:MAG: trypsin-like peptidase domain-containing protein [Gammaproteobacteria bacterium]